VLRDVLRREVLELKDAASVQPGPRHRATLGL
jgi:hypothetical protein